MAAPGVGRSEPQRSRPALAFAVAVLVAAYAVSFLDRQVISLLVEPLKRDLAISNTQVGILQGPAFGVFYAVLGLPLGWLADRVHRIRLIGAAILFWSTMTMACGFATSFGALLAARFGVGVGEAALVPAAVSLIADWFAPGRRALPLSVFTAGVSLGAGLALVLGGVFITYALHGAAGFPLIGSGLAARHPWQIVFILAGMVGVPVAGAVFTLREPAHAARRGVGGQLELSVLSGYLRQKRAFFLPMLLATSSLYILSNAVFAWAPSLFMRRFGWSAPEVGRFVGTAVMACAVLGNVLSGVVTGALERRGVRDAALRVMATGAWLMLAAALSLPWLPTAGTAMAGTMVLYFSIALTFGIATTALVSVTVPTLRGQVVALYLLLGNLVGLGLGPLIVGALMDHGGATLRQIGPALALVCSAVALPSAWLFERARRSFLQAVDAPVPDEHGAQRAGAPGLTEMVK